jgi:hypothetical protein
VKRLETEIEGSKTLFWIIIKDGEKVVAQTKAEVFLDVETGKLVFYHSNGYSYPS